MTVATTAAEEIFILPASLLSTYPERVQEFRDLAQRTGVAPGWHYLLDLTWTAEVLVASPLPVERVLDAGAGIGLLQWWLAGRGMTVISVDRDARYFSRRMRRIAAVEGAEAPLPSLRRAALDRMTHRHGAAVTRWLWRAGRASPDLILGAPKPESSSRVLVRQGDLRSLSFVASESVDAVVSISSLEHNTLEDLPAIVAELMRVLKPGGRLVATVGASKADDWFHEPSQGWCFTERTLRSIFGLHPDCPSNFDAYDDLMAELRDSNELRAGLSPLYFRSGNNGMPWGRWDPKYQSVGIIKTKLRSASSPIPTSPSDA